MHPIAEPGQRVLKTSKHVCVCVCIQQQHHGDRLLVFFTCTSNVNVLVYSNMQSWLLSESNLVFCYSMIDGSWMLVWIPSASVASLLNFSHVIVYKCCWHLMLGGCWQCDQRQVPSAGSLLFSHCRHRRVGGRGADVQRGLPCLSVAREVRLGPLTRQWTTAAPREMLC